MHDRSHCRVSRSRTDGGDGGTHTVLGMVWRSVRGHFHRARILLVPKIGAATFIALLVAGQMLASVAFDHFGLLGLTQRPVDLPRLIGVALLIGGVLLIRRP